MSGVCRSVAWPFALLLLAVCQVLGCTRDRARLAADRDVYQILDEKFDSPFWNVPQYTIQPDPRSRFYDPYDPDQPPMPPDDPAAHVYMHDVYGMRGYDDWHEHGDLPHVENPYWLMYLGGGPTDAHLCPRPYPLLAPLSLADSLELAYIHSRDFQSQLESLYATALALSFERFQWDVRFLGFLGEPGTSLFYDVQPNNQSDLTLGPTHFGLSKLLPTGGELAAEIANTTVWSFAGPDTMTTATTLSYSLVQPLLRAAGREIALESLTQSERDVLYAARDFARFRQEFFVSIVTGGQGAGVRGAGAFLIQAGLGGGGIGYLRLLQSLQQLRNQEISVELNRQQVEEMRELVLAGLEEPLQLTQLESRLQNELQQFLRAEANYADNLDRFKQQLGLPPDMPIEIDDAMLEPFELFDLRLDALEDELVAFNDELAVLRDFPTVAGFEAAGARLLELTAAVAEALTWLEEDYQRLLAVQEERLAHMQTDEEREEFLALIPQFRAQIDDLADRFRIIQQEIGTAVALVDQYRPILEIRERPGVSLPLFNVAVTLEDRIVGLLALGREDLMRTIREQRGLQASVRVELIMLEPVTIDRQQAECIALSQRLDFMNEHAFVVDAWRQVEVAADGLQAVLDLVVQGDIRTAPGTNNPFDFRAEASNFQFGLEFQAPLDVLQERNDYRAALINYQRARRGYMAAEDGLKLEVRREWRDLQVQRQSFEIVRRELRIAALQFDQAVEERDEPGVAAIQQAQQGLNLINALNDLINSLNNVVSTWVNYESARLTFYSAIGLMYIDANGIWADPYYQRLIYGSEPSQQTPPQTQPPPPGNAGPEQGPELPLPMAIWAVPQEQADAAAAAAINHRPAGYQQTPEPSGRRWHPRQTQ